MATASDPWSEPTIRWPVARFYLGLERAPGAYSNWTVVE